MIKIPVLAFCLTASVCFQAAAAPSNVILHYAGFAVSGEDADESKSFPYTHDLLSQRGSTDVDLQKELNRRVKDVISDHFSLTGDKSQSSKSGDSLAVAFVLTWENFAQEKVRPNYKITADLRAEVLIFDYQAMKVVAAVPFGVQSRDVLPQAPTEDDKKAIFRAMYIGDSHNIFDLFVKTLKSADIKMSYGAYTQLVGIDFDDNAQSQIKNLGVDLDQVREFIAGAFDASLSSNAAISVLPFIKGQAIGGTMAARFENGDVYNLTLPSPDFPIWLTVRGFKKVVLDSNAVETGLAYASYYRITIGRPLSETPYLASNFKYAVSKVVPKSVDDTDDWAAYQESILSFLDGFTRQLNSQDSRWLKQWSEDQDVQPQLAAAGQALLKCK